MWVLIFGVNGFIGNYLFECLLCDGCYEVYGMDIGFDVIEWFKVDLYFYFVEGDIGIYLEWFEYYVKKCDVILLLVVIVMFIEYMCNLLWVFELDFEENLWIVCYCVKYGKCVVFFFIFEVYGMCQDLDFDEDCLNLVVGLINKQCWIYLVFKQLFDWVIWVYGQQGLCFILFCLFNWMGLCLDCLDLVWIGSLWVIIQFILYLVEGMLICLVDGGVQKCCFIDVDDGIEVFVWIIDNCDGCCDGQIVNIGNLDNEVSICQFGEELLCQFEVYLLCVQFLFFVGFCEVESCSFYGDGYQDVVYCKLSIDNVWCLFDWQFIIELCEIIGKIFDFFFYEVFCECEVQV